MKNTQTNKTEKGFAAVINGKPLMQFENPTELYWFSSERDAIQAAKQLNPHQNSLITAVMQ